MSIFTRAHIDKHNMLQIPEKRMVEVFVFLIAAPIGTQHDANKVVNDKNIRIESVHIPSLILVHLLH